MDSRLEYRAMASWTKVQYPFYRPRRIIEGEARWRTRVMLAQFSNSTHFLTFLAPARVLLGVSALMPALRPRLLMPALHSAFGYVHSGATPVLYPAPPIDRPAGRAAAPSTRFVPAMEPWSYIASLIVIVA